jgi:putative salt-induced outer membrane protein
MVAPLKGLIMKIQNAVIAAALTLSLAGPAFAEGELLGTKALNDRIDDIETDVSDDMARSYDAARFGNPEHMPGLTGGVSLAYSGQSGNSDDQDFTLGLRLRHAQGQIVQSLNMAIDYSESTADGATSSSATTKDVFGVYDASYYFNDKFYGFALTRFKTDGLANEADDPSAAYKRDGFIGFGPGYRVVNNDTMTWRVQAGVGVSYLQDGNGDSTTETGYVAASRFFYRINENVFVSNDTDILSSDTALRIDNDLGVNVKMTDRFSTRVSYLSEYNDSRAIRTDNKVGVSLVMGF